MEWNHEKDKNWKDKQLNAQERKWLLWSILEALK